MPLNHARGRLRDGLGVQSVRSRSGLGGWWRESGLLVGPFKDGLEGTGGHADPDGFFPRCLIVEREALPDFRRPRANDRVIIRIVVWAPAENLEHR